LRRQSTGENRKVNIEKVGKEEKEAEGGNWE
jgi:hypothetical protein